MFSHVDENTFVVSDTHANHRQLLEFEPGRRVAMEEDGYTSFERDDHTNWLVERWNSTVGEDDDVVVLGDVAFSGVSAFVERLNGRLTVVLGNHDRRADYYRNLSNVVCVVDGLYTTFEGTSWYRLEAETSRYLSAFMAYVNGHSVLFSHYPVLTLSDGNSRNEDMLESVTLLGDNFTRFGCEYNVHGHVHSDESQSLSTRELNVSFEVYMRPVRLGDFL